MSMSLNSSYGQSLRSWLLLLVLIGSTNLVIGCKGPLSLLTGGGPNVAANVQAAKTAVQTVGSSVVTGDQKIEGSSGHMVQIQEQQSKLTAENVDKVIINETPVWLIIFLIVGWVLPSPQEIARLIKKWLKIQD